MPVYVGAEAVFVANSGSTLVTNSGFVTTPAVSAAVRPALWLGFRVAPRWRYRSFETAQAQAPRRPQPRQPTQNHAAT